MGNSQDTKEATIREFVIANRAVYLDNKTQIAEAILEQYPGLSTNKESLRKTVKSVITSLDQYGEKVVTDKKSGEVSWRDYATLMKLHQKIKKQSSNSQDKGSFHIQTDGKPLIIWAVSDLHLGAAATNYELLDQFTEILLKHDNIYALFLGDLIDNFVRFKNISAVHSQLINPKEQLHMLESWLDEIKHKIAGACWGNHEEMEERASGNNRVADLLGERMIYFNGIGKLELKVDDFKQEAVITHKTRYWSSFNLTHWLQQMARKDVPGGDIYIAGDRHEPACTQAPVGDRMLTFLQLGTWKHLGDTYSKRYFSYYTHPDMMPLVLDPKLKIVQPMRTIESALKYCGS